MEKSKQYLGQAWSCQLCKVLGPKSLFVAVIKTIKKLILNTDHGGHCVTNQSISGLNGYKTIGPAFSSSRQQGQSLLSCAHPAKPVASLLFPRRTRKSLTVVDWRYYYSGSDQRKYRQLLFYQ